jgi:hypothetical protein
MGNQQPSPKLFKKYKFLNNMDAVQRLDGSGYVKIKLFIIIFACLRYSLAPIGNFRVLAFSK